MSVTRQRPKCGPKSTRTRMYVFGVVNWPAVFDGAKRLECGELAD